MFTRNQTRTNRNQTVEGKTMEEMKSGTKYERAKESCGIGRATISGYAF
jgi:hypothetical protein